MAVKDFLECLFDIQFVMLFSILSSLTQMSDLLFKLLNECFRFVLIHFHSRSLDINYTLKKDKICLTVRGKK